MDELFFYEISDGYFIQIPTKSENDKLVYLSPLEKWKNYNGKIITSDIIKKYAEDDIFLIFVEDKKYYVFTDQKILAFYNIGNIKKIFSVYTELFNYKAKYYAENFRRDTREKLLNILGENEKYDLKYLLKALASYTFSCNYSFWIYNQYTEQFYLFSSSFSSEKEFIHKNDINQTLSEMLEGESNFISRKTTTGVLNSLKLSTMNHVNRLKVCSIDDSDFSISGILSFYSINHGFEFKKQIVSTIKNFVELKLIEHMSEYLSRYSSSIMRLTETYELGKLTECLKEFTNYLANNLKYEAASLWFYNESTKTLKLIAITEEPGRDEKIEPICDYSIGDISLTVESYKENKVVCSYDIDSEKNNSKKFNERTKSSPKTWIAIPISQHYGEQGKAIGVLRVKNKYKDDEKERKLLQIDKLDIDMLRNITSVIAYLKENDIYFTQQKQEAEEKLSKSIKESQKANDFIKTFRHELKSPLTTLTLASDNIKDTLIKEGLIKNSSVMPKKLKETLEDLNSVGERLAFVTNYLTFDAQGLVKDPDSRMIFKDIVAPVIQFADRYAKKRRKNIIIDKDSFLDLPEVYCDANASAIVFNILIDNAIKYANIDSRILVYGKEISNESCIIVVENTGFTIDEDEKDKIFEKYVRGRMADKQKTEGSGIGLYLAREIMKLNNGKVILMQRHNPTKFCIEINKRRPI
jgi:two-component system, OmpR family, sensor histidine kinase SenX3